jgi:hypothetical protein
MATLAPLRPIDTPDLVRVGRDNDGGYVLSARVLAATEVLLGLGINTDWSFETDFTRRNPRVRVVGVDGSVSLEQWNWIARHERRNAVLRLARGRPSAARSAWQESVAHWRLSRSFERFFRGPHRFVPSFITAESSPTSITWAGLIDSVRPTPGAPAPPIFLKMDIEGSEYDVLPDVLADETTLGAIVGMAIEFHDCGARWAEIAELFERLRPRFAVVHVHANNCSPMADDLPIPMVLEVTLVNRRLLTEDEQRRASTLRYPVPGLDHPNHPGWPDFELTF